MIFLIFNYIEDTNVSENNKKTQKQPFKRSNNAKRDMIIRKDDKINE